MSNMVIRFHGMEPKDRPGQLKDYLESLLRHAPSRSTCHLHIFKEPNGYLCKLTVHSNVKTFSAHSQNDTIKSTVKTVLKNVKEQIAGWKKNRSSLELTGVTSITNLNLTSWDAETEHFTEEEQYKKAA